MKFLMVFDFDHTVVDENSDLWVVRSVTKSSSYKPEETFGFMASSFFSDVFLADVFRPRLRVPTGGVCGWSTCAG